jgi:hypothetical protein
MKKTLLVAVVAFAINLVGLSVFASNTPNLQVQIFPLECSLDTVALGNVTSLHLTPENCLPQPPTPDQPPAGSDVSEPNPIRTPSYRFLVPGFDGSTSVISDRFVLPQAKRLHIADSNSSDKAGRPLSWVIPTILVAFFVAIICSLIFVRHRRRTTAPFND